MWSKSSETDPPRAATLVLKWQFVCVWNHQDPVMPSQEPSDAKSDEVDVPPDDAEDTHGGKTPLISLLMIP